LQQIRFVLILGAVLFASLGISDLPLPLAERNAIWVIRYGIVSPILLGFFFLTRFKIFRKWADFFTIFAATLTGFSLVIIMTIPTVQGSGEYFHEGMLLLLICFYSARVRFVLSTGGAWAVTFFYSIVAIFFDQQLFLPYLSHGNLALDFVKNNSHFFGVNLVGMFMAYSMEYSVRKAYYSQQLLEAEQKKVKSANKNLEKKISERTAEISATNKILQKEIRDRKKSERQNRELVENLPVGIYRAEPGADGKLLMGNPAVLKMFQLDKLPPRELKKIKIADLYADPIQRAAFSEKLKKERAVHGFELKMKKWDGEIFWISVSSKIIKKGKKIFFDGTIEDISIRKKAEEKLRESFEKLKQIDEMKTEFVSIASHQLRTPLTAIRWFLEMLADDEKLTAEQKDLLDQISQSSNRMLALVNDLLNVSRLESGKLKVVPKKFDLSATVATIKNEVAPLAAEKSHDLKISAPKNLPPVFADESLLSQVVQNLLSNAIKYTPERGKISVKLKTEKKFVHFEVADNGFGIPADDQKKLFGKFFRSKNVTGTEIDGSGLGLYIARSIVEKSGGKMDFHSVENEGSRFWFRVPVEV
jgi:PAS domain S-box-containing protein